MTAKRVTKSAKTGKFVSKSHAKKNPDTTYAQTVENPMDFLWKGEVAFSILEEGRHRFFFSPEQLINAFEKMGGETNEVAADVMRMALRSDNEKQRHSRKPRKTYPSLP